MNEDTERALIKEHCSAIIDAANNLHELAEELRKQLKEEYLAGFEDGCKAASLVRCMHCRFFLPVCIPQVYADTDPKSVFCQDSLSTMVCIKGHNGYETFGCTEGENKINEIQD